MSSTPSPDNSCEGTQDSAVRTPAGRFAALPSRRLLPHDWVFPPVTTGRPCARQVPIQAGNYAMHLAIHFRDTRAAVTSRSTTSSCADPSTRSIHQSHLRKRSLEFPVFWSGRDRFTLVDEQ